MAFFHGFYNSMSGKSACVLKVLIPLCILSESLATEVFGVKDTVKRVVNTAWWPPGTEKKAESVGIMSHGFVFMTAMMEMNKTLHATSIAELSDVRDIARAAGADLNDLASCLVNTGRGSAKKMRRAFLEALPVNARSSPPALTIVEMPGEYPVFNVSVSCIAALPTASSSGSFSEKRQSISDGLAYGVSAHGVLHVQGIKGFGNVKEAATSTLDSAIGLMRKAGSTQPMRHLVDCTVFLQNVSLAGEVRSAFKAAGMNASLSIFAAGLEVAKAALELTCTGVISVRKKEESKLDELTYFQNSDAVATEKFIFVPAQLGKNESGIDALMSLETQLQSAGSSLSDVVHCHFFLKDQNQVFKLFNGFYQVFNVNHPPPPARGEFQADSECATCAVAAKCIAARRPAIPNHLWI
eukprot:TRINITY_DN96203_c0_g1_i1.p1 TRINITY_DN96203_c0_g1~~TRINITY_DN96203_c0_g1_i1.p1  ORF type:complete len:411 (+),score=91.98 TRINITY_DN96203_c0_g1_i1:52-1284(+)